MKRCQKTYRRKMGDNSLSASQEFTLLLHVLVLYGNQKTFKDFMSETGLSAGCRHAGCD